MTDNFYETLHAEGFISNESLQRISTGRQKPVLFSVHWEIKTLLYVGVLMLSGGLGTLVYQNIDTIGHQFVLLFIALICAGSFAYCVKNTLPFSRSLVKAPNVYFDYLLLLGCISMLIFVGYLQFEYKTFGTNYGMVTFLPMVVLFFTAYYFDHMGVLSMAIANLALWLGISVTPKELLLNNDFNSGSIILTAIGLGIALLMAAIFTHLYDFKKHYKFSYQQYGVHVTYIALLSGYFHYYDSAVAALFILGIFALSVPLYLDAMRHKSFYFVVVVVLYCYITVSCLLTRLCILGADSGALQLLFFYYILSAVGFVMLLIHLNKKLKAA